MRCRALTISCGAALYHLRLALRCLGIPNDFKILPDGVTADTLARVKVSHELSHQCIPSEQEKKLFAAILKRRSNRGAFLGKPLPATLKQALMQAATDEGIALEWREVRASVELAAYCCSDERCLYWQKRFWALQLVYPRFTSEL